MSSPAPPRVDRYVPPNARTHQRSPTSAALPHEETPHKPLADSGVYNRHSLPETVRARYRAAGILPYVARPLNTATGDIVPSTTVLIGKQLTKSSDRLWRPRWSEFGGKIEDADEGVPEATALREFSEETGGQFTSPVLHDMCIWNRACKYILFLGLVHEVPTFLRTNEEIHEFRFVDLPSFMTAVHTASLDDAEVSFRTRSSINHPKAFRLLRSL